jgi:phospholipase D1/2
MEGDRDTETAMGAYQPHHLVGEQPPRAEVHGFRMSLWYEHTGKLDNAYLEPWSVDCIRMIKALGDEHWALWSGTLSNLPGFECFPESEGKILGTKSDTLPSILTD